MPCSFSISPEKEERRTSKDLPRPDIPSAALLFASRFSVGRSDDVLHALADVCEDVAVDGVVLIEKYAILIEFQTDRLL